MSGRDLHKLSNRKLNDNYVLISWHPKRNINILVTPGGGNLINYQYECPWIKFSRCLEQSVLSCSYLIYLMNIFFLFISRMYTCIKYVWKNLKRHPPYFFFDHCKAHNKTFVILCCEDLYRILMLQVHDKSQKGLVHENSLGPKL